MQASVFHSYTEADNPLIARQILDICNPARIFACYGELGAGKTTLIKSFCAALGVDSLVSSPTFTLVNVYNSPGGEVYHFDFYRIRSEAEAYEMGCFEYFDSGSYCFIEWPGRIPSLLPPGVVKVYVEAGEGGVRTIELSVE